MTVRIDNKKSVGDVQPETDQSPAAARPDAKNVPPGAPARPSALAQQVPTRGNVGQFARQSAATRYEEVRRALTAHPERADALIEDRLRGWSADDRAIVRAAVAERGNSGLKRYADAEGALRELGRFSPDERRDIQGIMRTGVSFRQAVGDERRALSAPTPEPSAARASNLREQALASAKNEAKEVTDLSRRVGALVRQIGSPARVAEVVAGGGSAMGLLGGSGWAAAKAAATGSTKPLKDFVRGAGDAGEMMVGGVTGSAGRSGRIAAADATAKKYFQANEQFTSARARFDRAARDGDYPGMIAAKRQMDEAVPEMRARAAQLEQQVAAIRRWDANLIKGGVAAGGQVMALGGAELPDAMLDVVRDKLFDIAVEEGVDYAAERAVGH